MLYTTVLSCLCQKLMVVLSYFPRAAGEYILEVRSVANPRVALRSSEPIKVAPAPMKQSEIGKLFDDLDDMLKFDI